MQLLEQTGAEIARVRGPNPEWMFIIVRGELAQAALNRAIDAYEGLSRSRGPLPAGRSLHPRTKRSLADG